MTFDEATAKLQQLDRESQQYLDRARFTDNKFIYDCQMGLYTLTQEKMRKIEEAYIY